MLYKVYGKAKAKVFIFSTTSAGRMQKKMVSSVTTKLCNQVNIPTKLIKRYTNMFELVISNDRKKCLANKYFNFAVVIPAYITMR